MCYGQNTVTVQGNAGALSVVLSMVTCRIEQYWKELNTPWK